MAAAPAALAQSPDGELVKVVILSRHGVRSPLVNQTELQKWTASKWPTWTCAGDKPWCPGCLTPEGAILAKQMGYYYRDHYKLFPAGCPATDHLYFWADTDQRTLVTGAALLTGLLDENCAYQPYLNWYKPSAKAAKKGKAAPDPDHCKPPAVDRIFHPVTNLRRKTDVVACTLDVPRAKREMSAQIPGLLASTSQPLSVAKCKLQCCLDGKCEPEWWKACSPPQEPPACTLEPTSTGVAASPKDAPTKVQLTGPARIASTFAEIVLLEWANRFPMSENRLEPADIIGFGRTSFDDMVDMFRLHTEAFNVEQRTPYVAKLQGSRLLTKILQALEEESDGKEGSAPAAAKFVAYVGHDTNISNLGAVLGLEWEQSPYKKNQTPPAGALIFELRTKDGNKFVHALYAAQPPRPCVTPSCTPETKPGLEPTPTWAGLPPAAVPTVLKSYSLKEFGDEVRQARRDGIVEACWK
jgi:4-phytase/acid phosphatase